MTRGSFSEQCLFGRKPPRSRIYFSSSLEPIVSGGIGCNTLRPEMSQSRPEIENLAPSSVFRSKLWPLSRTM
jgi:hypothetical protein